MQNCKFYFEGKCRCMNSVLNQDFYQEPLCESITDCYYKELQDVKSCYCYDPKRNNGRCSSYNRMAEDYERDLRNFELELGLEKDNVQELIELSISEKQQIYNLCKPIVDKTQGPKIDDKYILARTILGIIGEP